MSESVTLFRAPKVGAMAKVQCESCQRMTYQATAADGSRVVVDLEVTTFVSGVGNGGEVHRGRQLHSETCARFQRENARTRAELEQRARKG